MYDEFEIKLNKLKEITLSAIMAAENKDFDKLTELIDERKKIIDDIVTQDIPKEKLEGLFMKTDFEGLQDRLSSVIRLKQKEISSKLGDFSKGLKVTNNYNSNIIKKSIIFSKKV